MSVVSKKNSFIDSPGLEESGFFPSMSPVGANLKEDDRNAPFDTSPTNLAFPGQSADISDNSVTYIRTCT